MMNTVAKSIKYFINYILSLLLLTMLLSCLIYTYLHINVHDFEIIFHAVFTVVLPIIFFIKLIICLKNHIKNVCREDLTEIRYYVAAGHVLVAYILGFKFTSHITNMSAYISLSGDMINAEGQWSCILVKYAVMAEQTLLRESHNGSYGTETPDLSTVRTDIENYIFMTRDDLSKCPDDPQVKEEVSRLAKKGFAETKTLLNDNKEVVRMLAEEFAKKSDWTYEEITEFMTTHNIFVKNDADADNMEGIGYAKDGFNAND